MRTLYLLFERFGAFFLFLLLEAIAFFLIIQFNDSQRLILISSANRLTGTAYEGVSSVQNYFNLSTVADSLAAENARLRGLLENEKIDYTTDTISRNEAHNQQEYTLIAAKIINKSVSRHSNSITLNRGRVHGIEPHMGVISDKGVVGIVRKVSDHYAQVMPILHRQSITNVEIKRNRYFGPMIWRGRDPRYMRLEDIPRYVSVQKGDTIQTTGYSTIFPTGVSVGVVDTFWNDPGRDFQSILVSLFEDLSTAQYVYVVNHLKKAEQYQLEQGQTNE